LIDLKKISAIHAVISALVITGFINWIIFKLEINGVTAINSQQSEFFFPSSKIIGSVWTILVACLAFSFSRVIKKNTKLAFWLMILFLLCVFYPLYTLGFSFLPTMIFGNLVTIASASFIAGALVSSHKIESFLTLLISVWVIFVSYLMFYIN